MRAESVTGSVEIAPFAEQDVDDVRRLIAEYGASLGFDLRFQAFDDELAELPGRYAPPGGALLIARIDGEPIGCIGIRSLGGATCELKRLYVRPEHRSSGTGRRLVEAAVDAARRRGYRRMRLDTLPGMERAQGLYAQLGFREIAPYTDNPISGARFLELEL